MKVQLWSTAISTVFALVCLIGSPSSSIANTLVANGDFQGASGAFVDANDVQLAAPNGLPGWTFTAAQSPGASFLLVNSNDAFPGGGCCSAAFGGTGISGSLLTYDQISQVVMTTPGQEYDLSFSLRMDGGIPGDFQVWWDGSHADFAATSNGWDYTTYDFNVFGTGSDTLAFDGYDDASFFELSNVSVTPVPEPASIFMMLSGLAGMGEMIRRKVGR